MTIAFNHMIFLIVLISAQVPMLMITRRVGSLVGCRKVASSGIWWSKLVWDFSSK